MNTQSDLLESVRIGAYRSRIEAIFGRFSVLVIECRRERKLSKISRKSMDWEDSIDVYKTEYTAKSADVIRDDFRDFPVNGGKMIDSSEKAKPRDAKSRYQRR